jgi:hypothetical protein
MRQLLLILSVGWGNFYISSRRGVMREVATYSIMGWFVKLFCRRDNAILPFLIMSRWCKYTYSVGEMMQSYLLYKGWSNYIFYIDDAVVPSLWEEWCNYIFSVGDIMQWKEWCIYDYFSVGGMIQLFLCSPKDNTFIQKLLRRWCGYIFPSKGRCKETYSVGRKLQFLPIL